MQPFIDLHEDVLLHVKNRDVFSNWQTNFKMLERSNCKVVTATAFPNPRNGDYLDPSTNELITKDLLEYGQYCDDHNRWMIVMNAEDVRNCVRSRDRVGVILHVEGYNYIDDNYLDVLRKWYRFGLRSIGIVWNVTNPLGGGTVDQETGLSEKGRTVIEWAEEKGVIVDFAHMNEKTFWDTLKILRQPPVISHGNAASVFSSPRNYTDDQLRAVAEKGGVVGVFFARNFVGQKGTLVTMETLLAHFSHMKKVIGSDHIAIGTDFGGILNNFVEGLESLNDMPRFWDALRTVFSADEVEKIALKNSQRVLETILK